MVKFICRTCLSEANDAKEFISLYKEINIDESKSLELCKMLLNFTGIKCHKSDGMPNLVCRSCTKEICSSYFFRKKSLVSQALLKNEIIDYVKEEDDMEFEKTDSEMEEEDNNLVEIIEATGPSEINKYQCEDDTLNKCYAVDDNCLSNKVEMLDPEYEDYDIQYVYDENDQESTEETISQEVILDVSNDKIVSPEIVEHFKEFEIEKIEPDNCENHESNINMLNVSFARDVKEITYICEFCGKKSFKYETYRKHRSIHHKDKKEQWAKVNKNDTGLTYLCDFCGMDLASQSGLEIHRRQHTGERPHICMECGKGFTCKQYLKDHVRRHTEQIKFFCDICNKGFTRARNLQWHRKIHTDERPFQCKICSRKFLYKSKYNLHVRTHTGEKPYREYEQRRKPRIRRKKIQIKQEGNISE